MFDHSSMNMKEIFYCLKVVVYELKVNKPLHHTASIEKSPKIHIKFSPFIVQGIKVKPKSLPGQPPLFINKNRTLYSLKLPFQQIFLKLFYKGFKPHITFLMTPKQRSIAHSYSIDDPRAKNFIGRNPLCNESPLAAADSHEVIPLDRDINSMPNLLCNVHHAFASMDDDFSLQLYIATIRI
ncbi:hypothetical protein MANES_04G060150v8 [Manihot esculenta]|uniref:Uncharacterized protein n=2 Tax=Manihot esculenta TaxID=3983 RepID=A0ACB7HTP5_MANES|nr:hypothetical protein MANES_04G060150v8 [Manihot esculenta]KAG8655665.1 hypothetical protein MANES_04G060150v8 [Manihot esculenta]